ncbi:MAG: V-type ATP synthase subunit D [Chloroflexota bacterium]
MQLNVNATRMELLKLKRRLVTAKRGHKLLKDKRDELMKEFMKRIRDTRDIRRTVEEKLTVASRAFLVARAVMSDEVLEEAIMYPKVKVSLDVGAQNVMGVSVPVLKATTEGDPYNYGFVGTSAELDTALGKYNEALPDMIKLAEMERTIELLASEIEKTRRRVNALEYVMIPQLESTVRSIGMKLSEQERGNVTRLMKVKDIVRKEL